MAESENWAVAFHGPMDLCTHTEDGTPIVQKDMAGVSLYNWRTDEQGEMEFDDPKAAARFLKLAILNPAKAAKRMDMYIVI